MNPRLIETVHFFQSLPGKSIVQHFASKIRVHRLKRNIHWFHMIIYNAINVMIRHVCQCDIISLQKRKPGIIIFKIKCITHTFWHLINKAENTFIMAGTIVIHQTIFKLNPDIIFILFFYLKLPFFPVRFTYQKFHIFIIHQIMIVQNIFDLFPAYRNQFVSRFNFQFFRNASRQYF